MKRIQLILGLAGAAFLVGSGCSKQEPATPATATSAPKATPAPADKPGPVVGRPPETAGQLASPAAASSASPAANPVASPAPAAPVSAPPAATPAIASSSAAPATASATGNPNAQPLPAGQPATAAAQPTASALVPAAATLSNVASSVLGGWQKSLESQKLTLSQAATNQLQSATGSATNQTQVLIEKAKGLVSNQKYQDALTLLQQLSNIQLTPDQQKTVDSLKTQIQTGLAQRASDAATALGNILGGGKK